MGVGDSKEEDGEEGKNVSGASKTERLRKTDFSKIAAMDSDLLEDMAMKLWKQMSLRLKQKMKLRVIRMSSGIRYLEGEGI